MDRDTRFTARRSMRGSSGFGVFSCCAAATGAGHSRGLQTAVFRRCGPDRRQRSLWDRRRRSNIFRKKCSRRYISLAIDEEPGFRKRGDAEPGIRNPGSLPELWRTARRVVPWLGRSPVRVAEERLVELDAAVDRGGDFHEVYAT